MRRNHSLGFGIAATVLASLALFGACGRNGDPVLDSPPGDDGGLNSGQPDGGLPDSGSPDGGAPDGGGPPDGGPPDGGVPDGGRPDGGTDGGVIITFPDAGGWTFYGTQNGGPQMVHGVTSDASGNIWVAGGTEGLFLLKPGETRFHRYTMADGLRPYGYMPDGGAPPGEKYLSVLSVAGGPAGTVFAGYEGKPVPSGVADCESNWDSEHPDPSIYKSGDADRVTLQAGDRISVVHYDIFTGPGLIADELRGREKLCTIRRIAYHAASNSVWFGGNHGFAWGQANYQGNPTCDGQYECSGVLEHSHPAINGCADETPSCRPDHVYLFTGEYFGVAPLPNGDVWFGGANRSTLFLYGTYGYNWWQAGHDVECASCIANRIDVWPDAVGEPGIPTPSQRLDDNVSDMAVMPDGSVWIGSFTNGLAHYTRGRPTEFRHDTLIDPRGNAVGLELDSTDGSLWIGYSYGGLAKLNGNIYTPYDYRVLGPDLTQGWIPDIQSDNFGGHRRLLVAFGGGGGRPGAIGIYIGP